jgi:uncharacterized protein DUF6484
VTKYIADDEALGVGTASIEVVSQPCAVTAILAGFARTGAPLVDMPGDPPRTHVAARSCVPLNDVDVGKQVAIIPDANNPDSPIVIGIIQSPTSKSAVEITADGQSIAVRADKSIVLKCGDASITLNCDGRVVIRGKHVVTHASDVNRIRGGSVQLN